MKSVNFQKLEITRSKFGYFSKCSMSLISLAMENYDLTTMTGGRFVHMETQGLSFSPDHIRHSCDATVLQINQIHFLLCKTASIQQQQKKKSIKLELNPSCCINNQLFNINKDKVEIICMSVTFPVKTRTLLLCSVDFSQKGEILDI